MDNQTAAGCEVKEAEEELESDVSTQKGLFFSLKSLDHNNNNSKPQPQKHMTNQTIILISEIQSSERHRTTPGEHVESRAEYNVRNSLII